MNKPNDFDAFLLKHKFEPLNIPNTPDKEMNEKRMKVLEAELEINPEAENENV